MWLMKYYIKTQAKKTVLSEKKSDNLFLKIMKKLKSEEKRK